MRGSRGRGKAKAGCGMIGNAEWEFRGHHTELARETVFCVIGRGGLARREPGCVPWTRGIGTTSGGPGHQGWVPCP